MKKYILFIILICVLYACSDEKTTTGVGFSVSARDMNDNSLVKGGQYQLVDKSNNVVKTFTLSDGIVEMTDIPRGFYTVKEIVSPEGYTVQTEEKEIVIDSGVTECVFLYVNENTRVIPASMSVKFYSTENKQYLGDYNAVRIGEYYWIDRNFSHTVSYGADYENAYPISQDILDKYVGQIYIDNKYFQVNLGDFEKYYGRYYSYPSVLYLIKYGQIHNTYGTQIEGWRLPYSADYRQLFAMAPFNTSNDPAHTTLNERDVRFALSAKAGDNPMAFDINPGGGTPYKTYWFQYSNNMYKFNMMPGGARLNGDGAWTNGIEIYNGKKGDIYHLFYATYFAVGQANNDLFVGVVSLHDNMDTRNNESYHLLNVRWCRPLTDAELGYKLYINSAMTDIKKLDLKTAAPNGYKELPHGYIRGFYVQYILDKTNPAVTVQDIVKYAHQVQDNYVYGQTGVI